MKMRPDGGAAYGQHEGMYLGIIRRNRRKASIIGLLHGSGTPDGLESVKKTPQVAPVGVGPRMSAIADPDCDIYRNRANPRSVDVQPAPTQPRFDDTNPTRICH